MLFSKLTKYRTGLALALILGLALISSSPMPAQAQVPVDLELGGEGATTWNIENIKPGDSGTKTVDLHNAGSGNGTVTIWVSDIEETDCGEDGAMLDDYLLFNLSCERLSTNIALPVTIHELPQSAIDANQVKIDRLNAGETVTLVWEWEFPETGEPQNDVQGDGFSFTINYLLEELPSGDGGDSGGGWYVTPSYQQLEIDILGEVTVAKVSSSGEFLKSCIATGPEKKRSLEFPLGTKVTCINGRIPERIEVRLCEEPPPPPDGMEMIGPAYSLIGYISGSVPYSLVFDKLVELTLSYDSYLISENTSSIVIAFCEAAGGWVELEPVYGGVAQVNKISVLINHASIFAILAKIAPSPSLATAKFELSELAINPAQTEVGEPVIVSAIVQNTSELEGDYTLALRVNGVIEQSKEITLTAGESKQVSFTVIKGTPGIYAIALGDLSGEFIVLAPASSSPESHVYRWVILLVTGIMALVVYFLVIRLRRHS